MLFIKDIKTSLNTQSNSSFAKPYKLTMKLGSSDPQKYNI